MKAAVIALLAASVALTGCDSQPADERLELNMSNIKALCAAVGSKAWAESPFRVEEGLKRQLFVDGVKAECELEYRIKQQEANKPF